MGADGHLRIIRKQEWAENFPDVGPAEVGARESVVLGIPVVMAYADTEGRDDMNDLWLTNGASLYQELDVARTRLRMAEEAGGEYRSEYMKRNGTPAYKAAELAPKVAELEADPALPHSHRCWKAILWFEAKAEDIMVWT